MSGWKAQLWDDLDAAGGALVADLPLIRGSMRIAVDNMDALSLEVVRNAEWLAHASVHAVIRVIDEDGGSGPFEWLLSEISQSRDQQNSGVVGLRGISPLAALTFDALIAEPTTDGRTFYNLGGIGVTPAQYAETFVLPAIEASGSTYVTMGMFEDATPLDLAWDRWTARQLMEELRTRTNMELEFAPDGSTGRILNLWQERGSSHPVRDLRISRNVKILRWTQRADQIRTVVNPAGMVVPGAVEAAGIDQVAWSVEALAGGTSGGTVEIGDPTTGVDPVQFNDQLLGAALLTNDAALLPITSASTAQVLRTTGDISGLSTGQHLSIRASTAGDWLTELTNPAMAATSASGRIVGVYENAQLRNERNLAQNGLWANWAGRPLVYGCLKDGAAGSTYSIALKNLPSSGIQLRAGDRVFTYRQLQYFNDYLVRADTTSSTAGLITVTVATSGGTDDIPADSQVYLSLQANDRAPAGWIYDENRLACVQGGRRQLAQAEDLTVQTTGSSTSGYMVLTGLASTDEIEPGDILYSSSGATRRRILGAGPVSSSGTCRIALHNPTLYPASGATVVVERPVGISAEAGQVYHSVLHLQTQAFGISNIRPYIQSSPVTVLYDPTLPTIQVGVGLSYHAFSSSTGITAASTTFTPLKVELWDVNSSASLMTIEDADLNLPALTVEERLIQGTTYLSTDTRVAIRVYPPIYDANAANLAHSPDPFVHARFGMLALSPDPDVPPIEGSHGNQIWHIANRRLREWSAEADVYDVEIDDRSGVPGYNSTDESLNLGGTVRLYDDDLTLDKNLRMLMLDFDLADRRKVKATLARKPVLLSELLGRQKPQSRISIQIDVSGTTSTGGSAGSYDGESVGVPISSAPDVHYSQTQVTLGSPNQNPPSQVGAVRAIPTSTTPTSTGAVKKKVYPKYT